MGFIRPNVKLLRIFKLAVLDVVAVIVEPVDGERSSGAADKRHQ